MELQTLPPRVRSTPLFGADKDKVHLFSPCWALAGDFFSMTSQITFSRLEEEPLPMPAAAEGGDETMNEQSRHQAQLAAVDQTAIAMAAAGTLGRPPGITLGTSPGRKPPVEGDETVFESPERDSGGNEGINNEPGQQWLTEADPAGELEGVLPEVLESLSAERNGASKPAVANGRQEGAEEREQDQSTVSQMCRAICADFDSKLDAFIVVSYRFLLHRFHNVPEGY